MDKIKLDWEKSYDYYVESYEDLRKKTLFFVLAGGAITLALVVNLLAVFIVLK